jgi:hypothetical protein
MKHLIIFNLKIEYSLKTSRKIYKDLLNNYINKDIPKILYTKC